MALLKIQKADKIRKGNADCRSAWFRKVAFRCFAAGLVFQLLAVGLFLLHNVRFGLLPLEYDKAPGASETWHLIFILFAVGAIFSLCGCILVWRWWVGGKKKVK